MTTPILLRVTSANKQTKDIALNTPLLITVEQGATYKLLDANGKQALTGVVLKKKGNVLLVDVNQQPLLQIEDFYVPEQQAAFDVASTAEETKLIYASSAASNTNEVVWQTSTALSNNGAASETSKSGILLGGAVLLGLGLGGGGGGGGGDGGSNSSTATKNDNVVTGTIVAGPILPNNDLKVVVYRADGKTALGEGKVDGNGKFVVSVGDYKGVVIAKVINAGNGEDYLDEATNGSKDLNAEFFSMGVIGNDGNAVTLNVNALTTVAYQKALSQSNTTPLDETLVIQTNNAIAKAFGLNELHATIVIPVNGGKDFNAADGMSAGENYGAVLAAFSGADFNNGGNTQSTINKIVAGIKLDSTGGVTLDNLTRTELVMGSQVVSKVSGGAVPQVTENLPHPTVKDETPPNITSGNTTKIDENTIAGTVIYAAAASDEGGVKYSLKANAGDAAAFRINSSTGAVSLIERPNFEAKSNYNFTIIATDDAGNSQEKSVTLTINNLDDSAPTITSAANALKLNSKSVAGQVVYTATSTDAADISNGATTYSLKKVGEYATFNIDPSTGVVSLAVALPNLGQPTHYNFTVVATDSTGRASSKQVDMEVTPETVPQIALSDKSATNNDNVAVTSTALGTAYLVHDSVAVKRLSDITSAAKNLWNDAKITQVDTKVLIYQDGLSSGTYRAYVVDNAGNLSAASASSITLNDHAIAPVVDLRAHPLKLEAAGLENTDDYDAQITSLGQSGGYAVTWTGNDKPADTNIYVQKFNADGSLSGNLVKLDGYGKQYDQGIVFSQDINPQIATIGNNGSYAVTWSGTDAGGGDSIYVQRFAPDSSKMGNLTVLKGVSESYFYNTMPEIISLGASGAYVVAWTGFGNSTSNNKHLYVQKFNVDGVQLGSMTDIPTQVSGYNTLQPRATAIGGTGEYAITWLAPDEGGDNSIYVQKFNSDGSVTGSPVILEAAGMSNAHDTEQQIVALGNTGAYAVTWAAYNRANGGGSGVYLQQFKSDGSLSGKVITIANDSGGNLADYQPQIAAIGNAGEYVLTWKGMTKDFNTRSVYIQKFNADGSTKGDATQLNSTGNSSQPQIAAVGNLGNYVVTWSEKNANNLLNINIQLFDTDGHAMGSPVKFAVSDIRHDYAAKVEAVGLQGEYLVTWTGTDNIMGGNQSIFAQHFNADGTIKNTQPITNNDTVEISSSELGRAYLVRKDLIVNSLNDVQHAADNLWNETTVSNTKFGVNMPLAGLSVGSYVAYAADNAGNLSQASTQNVEISNTDKTPPVATFTAHHLNFATAANNENASTASLTTDGKYVVAWSSPSAIYAQTFNPDGSYAGSAVNVGKSNYHGTDPHVSTVGNAGDYVVSWSTVDDTLTGDQSIFVQKIRSDGSKVGSVVTLEATGVTTGDDIDSRIVAIGNKGKYVVTWSGEENRYGERSIYIQKFNADGSASGSIVKLEATGVTDADDNTPDIAAIGNAGAYAVAWSGKASAYGSSSIYIQRFNEDGTTSGNAVKVEAPTSNPNYANCRPQITALGNSGAYVVAWDDNYGNTFLQAFDATGKATGGVTKFEVPNTSSTSYNSGIFDVTTVGLAGDYVVAWAATDQPRADNFGYDSSIYVQKFHADGSKVGSTVMLEATGISDKNDSSQQVVAIGNTGEYVVTWSGGNGNIYVQKFNTTGEKAGATVQLDASSSSNDQAPQVVAVGNTGGYAVIWSAGSDFWVQQFNSDGTMSAQSRSLTNNDNISVQSNELGSAYIVNSAINVTSLSDISNAADDMWNSTSITTINRDTDLSLSGLKDGIYAIYSSDNAGNLSATTKQVIAIDSAPSIKAIELGNVVGAQGNYLNKGDVVTVNVTMSEKVNVTGTPKIGLDIGNNTHINMSYVSGSGSDTLVFQHAITETSAQKFTESYSGKYSGKYGKAEIRLDDGSIIDLSGHQAYLPSAGEIDHNIHFDIDTFASYLSFNTRTMANSNSLPFDSKEVGTIYLNGDKVPSYSTEAGTVYLVSDTVKVNQLSDITNAADNLWNSKTVTPSEFNTELAAEGLLDGTYHAYIVDKAGNLSAASDSQVTIATKTSTVVFDLVEGVSSNHSARTFQKDVDYTIFIRVPSADSALSTDGISANAGATWGAWSGANNLGHGDQIILVGNGTSLRGGPVDNLVEGGRVSQKLISWTTARMNPALQLDQQGILKHIYSGVAVTRDIWNGTMAIKSTGQFKTQLPSTLPKHVLTSQGLV